MFDVCHISYRKFSRCLLWLYNYWRQIQTTERIERTKHIQHTFAHVHAHTPIGLLLLFTVFDNTSVWDFSLLFFSFLFFLSFFRLFTLLLWLSGYAFLVTWITAFVMVVVHERVPDMKRYPPLPDIFLDNVPHIPWAFHMCEITGTLLFLIWTCVLIVHKHRFVLLRRFFALSGTVFLLRCVTMLITSLSVPGTHLQCRNDDYVVDDSK